MKFVSNSDRRGWLGCAGVTSLELALVLVPFLWMTMAIIDLGRYFFTVQSMVTLMTDAQHYAMINPALVNNIRCYDFKSWPGPTAATSQMLDPTSDLLCVDFPNQPNVYNVMQVKITVRNSFVPITPGLSALNSSMTPGVDGQPPVDGRLIEQATYSY
jgi:hypothetical protein